MLSSAKRGIKAIGVFLIIATLTACGGGSGAQTSLPEPRPLLEKAATEIQKVSSLNFKLQVKGAPAFISTDVGIQLQIENARGSYLAPDRVSATVDVRVAGAPTQAELVAIGDTQYTKHSIITLGRWLNLPFAPNFNADKLIRSEQGIKRALNSLSNVKMIGKEDLFGTQVYHITGAAPISDISAVTVNLIQGTGDVLVDVYIIVDTGMVERMVLTQPNTVTKEFPNPTTWTMEFFDYGDPKIKVDVPDKVEKGDFVNPAATPALIPGTIPAVPTREGTAKP